MPVTPYRARAELLEILRLFLRLGFTAYGGPAAHIAMFRQEVVDRRRWLTDERFLDLLGATNLIPGPNSTEMAIHIGYLRGGLPGLIIAGAAFILPAMVIVLAFAWAYVQFGSLPQAEWLLYGVKPVVIAIIAQALWMLGRKALKSRLTVLAGLAALAAYFLGVSPLTALVACGLLVMLAENLRLKRTTAPLVFALPGLWQAKNALASVEANLAGIFFTFLKIGSVLYGSGYVLLAFLHADFVTRLGWLTEQQIIDAVAIGQITPGPVFTTATFMGYLLKGVPGGLLATLGIFLPSFIFVGLSNPLIPRLRGSTWAGSLLDGVNAGSLGLMAAVTTQLGQAALIDPLTIALTLVSGLLLLRWRVNTTWLLLGGAIVGLLRQSLL